MGRFSSNIQAILRHPLKKDKRRRYRLNRQLESAGVQVRLPDRTMVYNSDLLSRMTNRVDNCFDIVVDDSRPKTINVLVPAFDFGSMSAGFFGVFQVARYVRRIGYHVRLVMYDEFDFNSERARENLKKYPGMEDLLDELEFVYIGDRKAALRVSPMDSCIATVWYSAYFAREIMNSCGGGRFLYLIQDYESVFYPCGSHFVLAEATYDFDCHALFSTQALQDFFIQRQIGNFHKDRSLYTYFNNACSSSLPTRTEFFASRKARKQLVFYCRPPVPRNMFELGALSLCRAVEIGVFALDEWEFIGIGLGEATIELAPGVAMKQLPRMALSEYLDTVSSFDVGLCLMASPHPSLMPFDLGGSGAVIVTNSFGTKTQAYFDSLLKGVIVSDPSVTSVVDGLREAVRRVSSLDERFDCASSMTFPRSWVETFDGRHEDFLGNVFGPPMA